MYVKMIDTMQFLVTAYNVNSGHVLPDMHECMLVLFLWRPNPSFSKAGNGPGDEAKCINFLDRSIAGI